VENLTECPACGHTTFSPYKTCVDWLVSQQTFHIVACDRCDLRFTNPRPTADQLGKYYQSDQYISHTDRSAGLIGSLYTLIRQFTIHQKVRLVNELSRNQPRTLLDIGCGTGLFLQAVQQAGWAIDGVEPDGNARQIAETRTGRTVLDDWQTLPADRQYDTITMWHVLEHIPGLRQLLGTVHDRLAPTGTFIVAVPNCAADDAIQYDAVWAAYDLPRHLYHFTPEVLEQVAAERGFTVVDRKPMPFDAFYVAMLSTQHRDGKTGYVESLLSGWRSNQRARQTGNYSSLTYILRKTDGITTGASKVNFDMK
jgi:2-polyprenyl-3-methyl-5-hydroxy-6-metoxy-1,4-benzoquinol methylase